MGLPFGCAMRGAIEAPGSGSPSRRGYSSASSSRGPTDRSRADQALRRVRGRVRENCRPAALGADHAAPWLPARELGEARPAVERCGPGIGWARPREASESDRRLAAVGRRRPGRARLGAQRDSQWWPQALGDFRNAPDFQWHRQKKAPGTVISAGRCPRRRRFSCWVEAQPWSSRRVVVRMRRYRDRGGHAPARAVFRLFLLTLSGQHADRSQELARAENSRACRGVFGRDQVRCAPSALSRGQPQPAAKRSEDPRRPGPLGSSHVEVVNKCWTASVIRGGWSWMDRGAPRLPAGSARDGRLFGGFGPCDSTA